MAAARNSGELLFDPFDSAFHEDPYPLYRRLRAGPPIWRNDAIGFSAASREAIPARLADGEIELAAAERVHSTKVRGFSKLPFRSSPTP